MKEVVKKDLKDHTNRNTVIIITIVCLAVVGAFLGYLYIYAENGLAVPEARKNLGFTLAGGNIQVKLLEFSTTSYVPFVEYECVRNEVGALTGGYHITQMIKYPDGDAMVIWFDQHDRKPSTNYDFPEVIEAVKNICFQEFGKEVSQGFVSEIVDERDIMQMVNGSFVNVREYDVKITKNNNTIVSMDPNEGWE